jgi:hypothetical protein
MQCTTCGHVFQPGERFCPDCGNSAPSALLADNAAFPPPSPAPDAMRGAPIAPTYSPATPPTPWPHGQDDSFTITPLTPAPTQVNRRTILATFIAALVLIAIVALIVAGAGDAGPLAGLFFHQSANTTPPGTISGSTGVTTNPAPTTAPQPTAASVATPTLAPAACATALPGSGTPSAGSGFSDVPFPAGATTTGVTQDSSGTGRYTVAQVAACAPNTSIRGIEQYYAQTLAGNGWVPATQGTTQRTKAPFDGGYMTPCPIMCWMKGTSTRFISLENVQAGGSGVVTYLLRTFTAPPAPNCGAGFAGLVVTWFWVIDDTQSVYVALPPLSLISQAGNNAQVCSAGTTASVYSFLEATLPVQGWTRLSLAGGTETWTQKGYTLTFTETDPTNWSLSYS